MGWYKHNTNATNVDIALYSTVNHGGGVLLQKRNKFAMAVAFKSKQT